MQQMTIEVYIPKLPILSALRDEFYKVAGKAGSRFGQAEEPAENGEYLRTYWLNVTQEIHRVIEDIEVALEQRLDLLKITFTMTDLDFQQFIKDELSAMAARMSKEAWTEYSPGLRQTLLEEGPFIVSRMRDQIVEYSQPRLFKVELEKTEPEAIAA